VENLNLKQKNMEDNYYQEKSEMVCPNCGEEMNLIIQGEIKVGVCENCRYIEPGYDNWLNQIIHLA